MTSDFSFHVTDKARPVDETSLHVDHLTDLTVVMDIGSEASAAAVGPTDRAGPAAGNSQIKTPSPSSASRHSPVTPLAPLEFLQNHRRGSITDPSLHAAPTSNHSQNLGHFPRPLRQPEPVSSAQPLPTSGYRFGEASRASDTTLPHFRQLLRSPSTEGDSPIERKPDRTPTGSVGPRDSAEDFIRDSMEIENHSQQHEHSQNRSTTDHIDVNTRRPSIAGTKRKLSSDRDTPMASNGEVDPHLTGPGVPNADSDGPAAKRRGSTFDTTRIAQLSLDERRNSVDGRAGPPPQWWSERRDSTASMFSANTPLTGYSTPSSGLPGDSPHGRPPTSIATFAWPVNPHTDQGQGPPPMQSEGGVAATPHYELGMMPPGPYSSDRRMSAPVISSENMSTPASGPTRLRQRSRPTSRARMKDQSAANNPQSPGPSGSNVIAEDASSQLQAPQKEPGSTPYSRSPELRVSHKLAERKRRKEMKELFDELRDQLPADRGMKASKWEILSKAVDFIATLKQSHQDMAREIEMLRHELDAVRQGLPPFGPGGPHPVVYPHGPPVGAPYAPPPGPQPGPPLSHAPPPVPPQHMSQQPPLSRPGSSHAPYPPGASLPQNGNSNQENTTTS